MTAATIIGARLSHRATPTAEVVDLGFQVEAPENLTFAAGQFVTLTVGHAPDGKPVLRSYSIASPPRALPHLRLVLKVGNDGPGAQFLATLAPGSAVQMAGPEGALVLDTGHHDDMVLAATGTGITPVMSMLGELSAHPPAGKRVLFWGLREENDLFLHTEIQSLCRAAGVDLRVHLSRPGDDWRGARGHISETLLATVPELTRPMFYLVGNRAMIHQVRAGLVAQGVDRARQIRNEGFVD